MPTNDTPRWQLWLLAHLPRPLAVMLMITIGGILCLLGALLMLLIFFLLVVVGKPFGVSATVIFIILMLAFVGVVLWGMYVEFNQQLPAREKKKGDDEDAG
jgi:hypothetical protein